MWDIANLKDYYDCVSDIINDDKVLEMKNFKQHAKVNCYEHCVYVSYLSFRICEALKIDYKAAARGGLLHDLFLYDWRVTSLESPHGFSHPKVALKNAESICHLSKKEKDIIVKHMWPLTLRAFPKCRESFIVSCVDKYCAITEALPLYRLFKIKRHLAQSQLTVNK